jgi:tetratricopeptide (TPR) repeat protein
LAQLVDKSMVAVQQTPLGPRYQLLETIRAYARLRLQASPDAASAPAAHLAWIANLCVDAQTRLLGHDDVDWFERFDLELDNIRTAFEWAIAARPWVAQQLATELWVYWWTRGMLVEGRDLAERALAADASTSAALRARVHAALAYIGYCQGDQRLLEEHAETAIALAAQAGDDRLAAWPMGWALVDLAELAHWNADLSLAQSRGQEALAIGERWGEDFVAARACSSLAYTAQDQNRPLDALSFAERGVFLARGLGSKIGISRTLYTVARLYWLQGESDAARLAYEESLAFSQEAGDKLGIRGAYEGLGILAYESGDEAAARSSFEYVLEVTEAMGQPAQFRARELLTLGSTALRHGDVGPGRAWLDEARRLAHRAGDTETLQAINDFDRGAHTEPVAGR